MRSWSSGIVATLMVGAGVTFINPPVLAASQSVGWSGYTPTNQAPTALYTYSCGGGPTSTGMSVCTLVKVTAAAPDVINPPGDVCNAAVDKPTGTYNPDTAYLTAKVSGFITCSFYTPSIEGEIFFEGHTGSQNIDKAGGSWDCAGTNKCLHSPVLSATYEDQPPCNTVAEYDHFGVMRWTYLLPNRTPAGGVQDGPSNTGEVYRVCA